MTEGKKPVVLLVEDDPGDQVLTEEAFGKTDLDIDLRIVSDGEEAFDYMYGRKDFASPGSAPRPDLILLDLNLPKVNGKEIAGKLKSDEAKQSIPIVILSTSGNLEEVKHCYAVGANAYLKKPQDFKEFINLVQIITNWWFKSVILPPHPGS